MIGWLVRRFRRFVRRHDEREPLPERLQRAHDEEQATADSMQADRRLTDNERRQRWLRSQIDVYHDDLHFRRGR